MSVQCQRSRSSEGQSLRSRSFQCQRSRFKVTPRLRSFQGQIQLGQGHFKVHHKVHFKITGPTLALNLL